MNPFHFISAHSLTILTQKFITITQVDHIILTTNYRFRQVCASWRDTGIFERQPSQCLKTYILIRGFFPTGAPGKPTLSLLLLRSNTAFNGKHFSYKAPIYNNKTVRVGIDRPVFIYFRFKDVIIQSFVYIAKLYLLFFQCQLLLYQL